MKGSPEKQTDPPVRSRWAPGAEPLAICMSCSSTYPTNFSECPNCQVGLSVIRKCPSCGRIQSAYHVTCIYCADSFIREDGLGPLKSGPLARRRELAEQRLRIVGGVVLALGIAAGAAFLLTRDSWRGTPQVIGQTYVLAATSMRAQAAANAPPVKDLQASEVLKITDYTIDAMGNRWFRVASADVHGFVRVQNVAPPKSTHAEKGFEILRHSLMGLEEPEVLPAAAQAVDFYRTSFPSSSHGDELRWLIAERTREMAKQSRRPQALLDSAREQFEKISQGGGEYADRARDALEQHSTVASSSGGERLASPSSTLEFAVVGGSVAVSRGTSGGAGAPVRRVTVVSRTPLLVRLTQPAQILPGATFQGEIAQDIRVGREVAIPRSSPATLMVSQGGTSSGVDRLQLTGATVNGETFRVFGGGVRIEVPGRTSSPPLRNLPATLPAGTRVEFRLQADLVITYR